MNRVLKNIDIGQTFRYSYYDHMVLLQAKCTHLMGAFRRREHPVDKKFCVFWLLLCAG